jgi:ethanolamine ammonia-lyase small subunit
MSEANLRKIIEEVVLSYYENNETKPVATEVAKESKQVSEVDPGSIEDITKYTIENHFAVPNPENKDAYLNYKKSTPARVGIWRAGPRYKTETMLRFRADHAIAQDAVFNNVPEAYAKDLGWLEIQTVIKEKDEYLTRPDLGRILDDEAVKALAHKYQSPPKVLVYVCDGLSSIAIETNAYDTFKSIEMGLKAEGISVPEPFFLRYGRVPAMDHVSEVTGADVTVVLIGERPGLATGESMSCYMIYKGKEGNNE